jgi:DNA repair exonuclease SbcCD nuclease subunit
MTSYPVAVSVSDLHLCQSAPPCRSKEVDWYRAMKTALEQLKLLRDKLNPNLPIIVAGDIFDKWNPPHELVNFALKELPHIYAVPGQHDLPHHNLTDIKKSAYWTLVEAGRITNLEYQNPVGSGELMLYGFPWGTPLAACEQITPLCLHVAVIHHLVYTRATGYPGAPDDSKAKRLIAKLKGFDVAIFGDNHIGFIFGDKDDPPLVLNNGGFMRRRSNEENYTPCVGVLYSDGDVKRIPLGAFEVFHKVDKQEDKQDTRRDFKELLGDISGLSEVSSDFKQELHRELARREVSQKVKDYIWMSVEEDR